MSLNKIVIIPSLLILFAIIANIFLSSYMIQNRYIGVDQTQHFYDMKKWYESGKFPTTSARFIASEVVNEELTTPRVPGGAYYIFYTLFYKLSGESLLGARIINFIFNLLIISIFLFWLYKKFGFFILGFITPLILCNGYFIIAITDFWNPSLVLILSFITYILFYEYIGNKNENIKKLSAVFLFPFLAVMGQSHFATFFSFTSTLIVYLIIRFKYTKKYLLFWGIGIFISFLLYLPYLISEIQNGFQNTMMILNTREGLRNWPFPQIWAVLLYPTNEMSTYFGSRLNAIIYFWFSKPPYIYGFIFLILSILFSAFCFIRSIILLINKKYIDDIDKNLGEMYFLLLLSIPVTIISFIVFKSKSGTFWYLYSLFSFSFTPIFLFFYRIRNNVNNIKYLFIISLMLLLNIFAMSGELIRYVNLYEYSRDYNVLKDVAEFIKEDAKDKKVRMTYLYDPKDTYNDIFRIYFPEYDIKISENPDIQYIIKDKTWEYNWDKERNKRDMQYIYDNNGKELTNIGAIVLYRCYN